VVVILDLILDMNLALTHTDDTILQCAFMKGQVADQASAWNLPDEILLWIWEHGMRT